MRMDSGMITCVECCDDFVHGRLDHLHVFDFYMMQRVLDILEQNNIRSGMLDIESVMVIQTSCTQCFPHTCAETQAHTKTMSTPPALCKTHQDCCLHIGGILKCPGNELRIVDRWTIRRRPLASKNPENKIN